MIQRELGTLSVNVQARVDDAIRRLFALAADEGVMGVKTHGDVTRPQP